MIIVKFLYVVAIAVLLVLLVIVGVQAFYPGPAHPEYPEYPTLREPTPPYGTPEYEEWEEEWQEEWDRVQEEWARLDEEYRQLAAAYHRSMFLVVLPLGAVFAVGGAYIRRKLDIFGAGLVLGGMGTMIYAIVPDDLDSRLRFIGIAVALAVLLFVGYKVFNSRRRA